MIRYKGPLLRGLFFLFLMSCAGIDREAHINYRIYFKQGKYKEAIELLKSSSLAKDKETKLMFLMDLGMGYYQYGDYLKAIDTFQAAKNLSQELYTISISKKAKSIVTNDYADDYITFAKDNGCLLVPNVLDELFGNKKLMVDTVHPNAKGYTIVAKEFYKVIKNYVN